MLEQIVNIWKKSSKFIFYFTALLLIAAVINCSGKPIFTDLETAKLQVIIKGTYASSGNAEPFTFPGHGAVADDSIAQNGTGGDDADPTTFMMDIAEIRLVDVDGEDHKFANYRQGFATPFDGTSPFFDGTGISLENDDAPPKTYVAALLYVRKMIFDSAVEYGINNTGWYKVEDHQTVFFENDVFGFNFNALQVEKYTDNVRYETADANRVFPVLCTIPGGFNFRTDEPTVLELRMLISRFIEKYEYSYYEDNDFRVVHYFALADRLSDVQAGTSSTRADNYIGGNLHAVARMYEPGNSGKITITNAGSGNYYIAIPTGEDINNYVHSPVDRGGAGGVCDFGRAELAPRSNPVQWIDYYLRAERYYNHFNSTLATCLNSTAYEAAWDPYFAEVDSFKIPAHVLYRDGVQPDEITNVAPGQYDVYRISLPGYGALPAAATASTENPTPITVTAGGTSTASF